MGTNYIVPIIDHGIYIGLPVSERKMLYECWNKGRVDIAPISHADIRYTLSYIDKQVFGARQLFQEFGDFEPPFAHFSKGLGVEWIEKNMSKFDETGTIHFTDTKKYILPPYFRDKYDFIKPHKMYSDSVVNFAKERNITDLDEAQRQRNYLVKQSLQHKEIRKLGHITKLEEDEFIQAYYKYFED